MNKFLQREGEFENCSTDEVYNEDGQVIEATQFDILQLKDNNILKSLVPLEDLFDQDDVARKPTLVPTEKGVKDMNIETIDKPKLSSCPKYCLLR